MVFISLPAIDEHLNAAPSTNHDILARNVRSPSVVVHHAACAILSDHQNMKHVISPEVGVEWIKISMTRTKVHIQSMVA